MTDKIVVLCTCGSAEEAEKIARVLVDARLAACVSVTAPVRSYYRWHGVMESAEEWMLVIKSSEGLFEKLCDAVAAVHSNEIPELIALPITAGAQPYMQWMEGELV